MATLGPNAAVLAAAEALGVRNDPFMSFSFLVELEGLIVGGFSEVSGLQIETEIKEYREGGLNEYVHRFVGPTKYPSNLVLKHGLTALEGLWLWHQDVVQGVIERRNGTVYLLSEQRLPLMWWDVIDAVPVKWSGPELKADSSAIAVQSVELAHRGISKPRLASAVAARRGVASDGVA